MNRDNPLIWVEISRSALAHNFRIFREIVGGEVELAPMIKSNAYGHGLEICAKIFREEGAEYLAVNSIFEAIKIRATGDRGKVYVAGYTPFSELNIASELEIEFAVYNFETLEKLDELNLPFKIHLKVETGTNRQGVQKNAIPRFLDKIRSLEKVTLVGAAMHFADIEDTRTHEFAEKQLTEFLAIRKMIEAAGFQNLKFHAANSAATILFPKTHLEICRTGITNYGMWPSEETRLSLDESSRAKIIFKPAFTWKTRIVQIKTIQKGETVGYGRTFIAPRETRIATLPVGYYDGFARKYAEKGFVLVAGKRAKITGRICMNIFMVDVTDIPKAKLEDEVVLLGRMGDEEITAEEIGDWGGTINYEIPTRVRENILRKVVD